tara:strand:- start:53 stop:643 length:591 start_codon:yes stop_codon:yes gene_type:complete
MIKDYYGKYQPILNYYKVKLKEVYLFKHIYHEDEDKDNKDIIQNEFNDNDDDDTKSVSSYSSLNSINSFNSLKTDFSDYNLLNTYSSGYVQDNQKKKLRRLIILYSYKVNFLLYRSDNSVVEQFRLRITNTYEDELIKVVNVKKNTNYVAKNVYYREENENKFIHIPDYTPPKTNRNNVYHKLRMGKFDTICIEIE